MRVKPAEWAIAGFTAAYVGVFALWFFSIGNYEFIWYILTMLGLILLVGTTLRTAEFPPALLWALSFWGLAHMAGGGVPVGDSVLYSALIVPISQNGEMSFLKYDQIVHAYGFGVTAWLLWHLMRRHYPATRGSWTLALYPAIGAMGLGAVNEIIEFIAVLAIADTNVGGYVNTALDLCFNAAGAVIAVTVLSLRAR